MNTKPNNYIYSDTLMHKNGHFKYIKKVKGKNGKTNSISIDKDNKHLLDSGYTINIGKPLFKKKELEKYIS